MELHNPPPAVLERRALPTTGTGDSWLAYDMAVRHAMGEGRVIQAEDELDRPLREAKEDHEGATADQAARQHRGFWPMRNRELERHGEDGQASWRTRELSQAFGNIHPEGAAGSRS